MGVPPNFQHILRVLNTNIEGKTSVMFALTSIKGIGRRYANIVLKKADIPLSKRAGELTEEDTEKLITIMQNPRQYKIPDWFLNRQRDIKDGKTTQVMANILDNKLREDLERLKKIRAHRGLRHYWGLRVRGQHTKTTGRRGRTVGVSKRREANLKGHSLHGHFARRRCNVISIAVARTFCLRFRYFSLQRIYHRAILLQNLLLRMKKSFLKNWHHRRYTVLSAI